MLSNIVNIQDAPKEALKRERAPDADSVAGHRILVLDDEPDVAHTIATQVSSLGYQVHAVTDYAEFREALGSFRPDILVIDTFMPGHDALDVIRDLDHDTPMQIIVTSGYGQRIIDTVAQSARHYGHEVLGGLPKPIRRRALKDLLVRSDTAAPAAVAPETKSDTAFTPTEADLRAAFCKEHLVPYFQPKLCLKTRQIVGFEALVRWVHPEHGVLSPSAFLTAIEAHGLETDLTFLMLDKACAFISGLPDPAVQIAINVPLSIVQLEEFRERLDHTVHRHKLIPGRLIIEITKAGDAELTQAEVETLARLRLAGYVLSLDNFGTGASGLTRLVRAPFAEFKIDRSFIQGLDQSEQAQGVLASLVKLGKSLDVQVTVDGIEDEATLAHLAALGCDMAQGYQVAPPMAAEDAERLFLEAEIG